MSAASLAVYPAHIVIRKASADTASVPPFLRRFRRITSSGNYIAEIDGLRFIAIFLVVLFHLAVGLFMKAPQRFAPPAHSVLAIVAWNGFHGVELFFVISGFVLGLPFAAHRLKAAPEVPLGSYLLRRVTRLEPPYIVSMVAMFLLLVLVKGVPERELMPRLLASLVYVHNMVFGSESPINNIAWSLEIEVQFYLLAPLLALVFAIRNKYGRRAVLIAACALSVTGSWALIAPAQTAYFTILRFLHFFLLGFLLADVYLMDWNERPAARWHWDLVSLAGWPLLFWIWSRTGFMVPGAVPPREPLVSALLFPCILFLLYCAAFRGPLTNRLIKNPYLSVIGGMCYSLYLLHNRELGGILDVTRRMAFSGIYSLDLLLQLAIATPFLLLVCGTYFLLIEKPCMRKDWPRRLMTRLHALRPEGLVE